MFVVDTNVLAYAANRGAAEHGRCKAFVDRCVAQQTRWYLTWGILYEFLRVVTHTRAISHPQPLVQAWEFVETLLASPGLAFLEQTPRHATIAAQTWKESPSLRGNRMLDAHTAVLMREHGIRRIYTHDKDFQKFAFLEVVDPLKQA